jgi:hypothetical protein
MSLAPRGSAKDVMAGFTGHCQADRPVKPACLCLTTNKSSMTFLYIRHVTGWRELSSNKSPLASVYIEHVTGWQHVRCVRYRAVNFVESLTENINHSLYNDGQKKQQTSRSNSHPSC